MRTTYVGNFNSHIEEIAAKTLSPLGLRDNASLANSFSGFQIVLLNNLNRLTRALEMYLSFYVSDEQVKNIIPPKQIESIISNNKIKRVISFNYTDTFERLYGINMKKSNDSIEYDYIHGKAKKNQNVDTCNLVLGIDEYLDVPDRDCDNEFIEYKKFYQMVFKKTGSEYKKWLGRRNEINASTPKSQATKLNIFFYGHSLDVTDKDIIGELIKQEAATTTIFYHNRVALGQYISNLVKILGEEELINRTGAYKPSIVFKPLNENDSFELQNQSLT